MGRLRISDKFYARWRIKGAARGCQIRGDEEKRISGVIPHTHWQHAQSGGSNSLTNCSCVENTRFRPVRRPGGETFSISARSPHEHAGCCVYQMKLFCSLVGRPRLRIRPNQRRRNTFRRLSLPECGAGSSGGQLSTWLEPMKRTERREEDEKGIAEYRN